MAIPADDGVSPMYWDAETGVLIDRASGLAVFDDDGEAIYWREPEPDPNETLPYVGPTLWAVTAYRLDLPPETAVTIWVEKPTVGEAIALFNDTAGAGMGMLFIDLWNPMNQAHHLRWLNGLEGNLAAIIQQT